MNEKEMSPIFDKKGFSLFRVVAFLNLSIWGDEDYFLTLIGDASCG
jgi:hypothetical protein